MKFTQKFKDRVSIQVINLATNGEAMIPIGYADNYVGRLLEEIENRTCSNCNFNRLCEVQWAIERATEEIDNTEESPFIDFSCTYWKEED